MLIGCAPLVQSCDFDNDRSMQRGVTGPRCEVGAIRQTLAAPAGKAVVLGCGLTRAGTRVQIYSFRDAGGPCLNIAGLPGGTRACGRAPSERVPAARNVIGGGVIVRRSPAGPLELYGETAPNVRRVLLTYRMPSTRPHQREATLVRVTHRTALNRARISHPFGYFVGAIPPRAIRVAAIALDGAGDPLGRLGFDRLGRSTRPNTVFIASENYGL
jgi:hypothetical protein